MCTCMYSIIYRIENRDSCPLSLGLLSLSLSLSLLLCLSLCIITKLAPPPPKLLYLPSVLLSLTLRYWSSGKNWSTYLNMATSRPEVCLMSHVWMSHYVPIRHQLNGFNSKKKSSTGLYSGTKMSQTVQMSRSVFKYRVAKTHRMPDLYRSFLATKPYDYWLFCEKWPAT